MSNELKTTVVTQTVTKVNGDTLRKHYRRQQLLGKGTFANCYKFTCIQTNQLNATKVFSKGSHLKDKQLKQKIEDILSCEVRNEIKIHKTLHHQNIVELREVFEDDRNLYIMLELCENGSLKEELTKKRKLQPELVRKYVRGLVQGVQYLHSQKIIHRDLKLANIFLSRNGEIKIGDFGLATKLDTRSERRRTLCGTPNYIAPEILERKGYGFQVDIWSIGVLIYTLLIGYAPFQTGEINSTYKLILKNRYYFPQKCDIPIQARSLIRQILQLDPSKRPTVDQILESDFLNDKRHIARILTTAPDVRYDKQQDTKKYFATEPQHTVGNMQPQSVVSVQSWQQTDHNLFYLLSDSSVGYISGQISLLAFSNSPVDTYYRIQSKKLSRLNNSPADSYYKIMLSQYKDLQRLPIEPDHTQRPVYVTKFMKHNSCAIFRLSNRSVNVKFDDGSHIAVNNKHVMDMKRNGVRLYTGDLERFLKLCNPDLKEKQSYIRALFMQQ